MGIGIINDLTPFGTVREEGRPCTMGYYYVTDMGDQGKGWMMGYEEEEESEKAG